MKIYNLKLATIDSLYNLILNFSLVMGGSIVFTKRKSPFEKSLGDLILKLGSNIYKVQETSVWPGTILYNQCAHLYFYKVNKESINLLLKYFPTFDSWNNLYHLEDLSALREDGRPWFISITHENDFYFKFSDEERMCFEHFLGKRILVEQGEDLYPEERYY